jgi:hypothetical protein
MLFPSGISRGTRIGLDLLTTADILRRKQRSMDLNLRMGPDFP